MDKKILKYKTKKNKLENEILEILNRKKENYENEIANSNDNRVIVEFIENFLNELKLNNQNFNKKIIIIVSGNYSVGKTTFVSNLENYILKISGNILNIFENDFIDKITLDNSLFEIKNKITIIKIKNETITNGSITNGSITNLVNKMNNDIENISVLNIKIIPKDKNSLKNKYINKIIYDIKNNTSYFIENLNTLNNINNINNINNNLLNNIQNNIQLLKLKKSLYTDDDFIFLDHIVDLVFNSKHDILTNCELNKFNITTFYL